MAREARPALPARPKNDDSVLEDVPHERVERLADADYIVNVSTRGRSTGWAITTTSSPTPRAAACRWCAATRLRRAARRRSRAVRRRLALRYEEVGGESIITASRTRRSTAKA
ncbi:MAG: hypothetical protein U1F37_13160 [Alphaproteobacteria bacterium]